MLCKRMPAPVLKYFISVFTCDSITPQCKIFPSIKIKQLIKKLIYTLNPCVGVSLQEIQHLKLPDVLNMADSKNHVIVL